MTVTYRRAVLAVLGSVLGLLLATGSARADVPGKINYQGRLADGTTGEPLPGSHNVTFRLYDAATDGNELWTESQVVMVDSAGVMSAVLGSTTPIDVGFDGATWLEVEVDGEVLSPRREIVSVVYAFRALNADSLGGFHSGSFALADHTHDDRYVTRDSLADAGTVNSPENPVAWSRLKSVPSGFADGTDDVGEAGDGHSLDADDGDPVDALYVDAQGDVGVGTTTPDEKLEVAGTVHSTGGGFKFPDGTVQSTAVTGVEIGGGWVDDSTVVRLESPGDSVGIGTGTPSAKLDVAGTAKMEGFKMPSGADSGYVLTSDADGMGTWQATATYADTAHQHDDRYYTESELNTSDGDDPNTGSNRVSWDNLTDVPADFADGSDEVGGSGDGHSLDADDGDPVDALYVGETGYVGIGMVPEARLDIHESTGAFCYLRLTTGDTGTGFSDGTRFYVGPGGHAQIRNLEAADLLFGTDNTVRMNIAADGQVGIGALGFAPLDMLHVNQFDPGGSYSRFTNSQTGMTSTDGFRVGIDEDGDAGLWNYENKYVRIGTNDTERMRITHLGNVGIGTSNPTWNLHLHESDPTQCVLFMSNAGTGVGTGDGLRFTLSNSGAAFLVNNEDAELNLGAGGLSTLTVDPDRKVGINENEPNYELHINKYGADTDCYMQMTNYTIGNAADDGLLMGIDHDGNAYLDNQEYGPLYLRTGDDTHLVITSDGDVGIGTTTPAHEMHLHNSSIAPAYLGISNYNTGWGSTDGLKMGVDDVGEGYLINHEDAGLTFATDNLIRMYIEADGNVGIGTTKHCPGPSTCYAQWTNGTTGDGFNDGLRMGIFIDGRAYIHNSENTSLAILTNATERMRIAAGGNVGIGDNDPKVKLAVTGLARVQNLAAWPTEGEGMELAYNADLDRGYIQVYDRDGGTWGDLFLGDGHVGIGTAGPTSKLDVDGDAGQNQLRLRQSYTPTGTSDPKGETGQIAWDDNWVYVKTSAGWKRAQLSGF
jgi:hypothetical protein